MAKKKRKEKTKVNRLETFLLKRSGKIAHIYANSIDKEFKKIIDDKIKYLWDFIYNIDDVVNEKDFIKRELKEKLDKKKALTSVDEIDEIIYYNKNMQKLINIEKVKKALYHFNIKVSVEDIIQMFLNFTNNEYFKKILKNDLYVKNIVEIKKKQKKFETLNIKDLYINYETFKFIFLNIDLNIERNGLIW